MINLKIWESSRLNSTMYFYSGKLKSHIHEENDSLHAPKDKLSISGTQAREMLKRGEAPPEWFMRPEISKLITKAIKNNKPVFV